MPDSTIQVEVNPRRAVADVLALCHSAAAHSRASAPGEASAGFAQVVEVWRRRPVLDPGHGALLVRVPIAWNSQLGSSGPGCPRRQVSPATVPTSQPGFPAVSQQWKRSVRVRPRRNGRRRNRTEHFTSPAGGVIVKPSSSARRCHWRSGADSSRCAAVRSRILPTSPTR